MRNSNAIEEKKKSIETLTNQQMNDKSLKLVEIFGLNWQLSFEILKSLIDKNLFNQEENLIRQKVQGFISVKN